MRYQARWHPVVVVAVLLGTMAYAIAEELTLATLYPSPRGVYRTLRVGSAAVSGVGAQLHVVSVDPTPAFQIEDSAGNPWMIVTDTGLVDLSQRLRVRGGASPSGLETGMVLTAEDTTGLTKWEYPTYAPGP